MTLARRNLLILALCQGLAMTAMTMVVTTIALVGLELYPVKALGRFRSHCSSA